MILFQASISWIPLHFMILKKKIQKKKIFSGFFFFFSENFFGIFFIIYTSFLYTVIVIWWILRFPCWHDNYKKFIKNVDLEILFE